jgi:hypothetical protein
MVIKGTEEAMEVAMEITVATVDTIKDTVVVDIIMITLTKYSIKFAVDVSFSHRLWKFYPACHVTQFTLS